jgi:hypothetical protein
MPLINVIELSGKLNSGIVSCWYNNTEFEVRLTDEYTSMLAQDVTVVFVGADVPSVKITQGCFYKVYDKEFIELNIYHVARKCKILGSWDRISTIGDALQALRLGYYDIWLSTMNACLLKRRYLTIEHYAAIIPEEHLKYACVIYPESELFTLRLIDEVDKAKVSRPLPLMKVHESCQLVDGVICIDDLDAKYKIMVKPSFKTLSKKKRKHSKSVRVAYVRNPKDDTYIFRVTDQKDDVLEVFQVTEFKDKKCHPLKIMSSHEQTSILKKRYPIWHALVARKLKTDTLKIFQELTDEEKFFGCLLYASDEIHERLMAHVPLLDTRT